MAIDPTTNCAICDPPTTDGVKTGMSRSNGLVIDCPQCGRYELIGHDANFGSFQWPPELKRPLSCAARQASESGHPLRITYANVAEFSEPHTASRVADNQERLLREVARKAGRPQGGAAFSPTTDFTLIDCYSREEFVWYIDSLKRPKARVCNWCGSGEFSTHAIRGRLEASSTASADGWNPKPMFLGDVVR
jgi:hypothetical protein